MVYVEGFITPVPKAGLKTFIDHSVQAAPLFREFGASRIIDAIAEDVPHGEVTDFYRAVQASEEETVCFGWIEYPDKDTREAAVQKMMSDSRMQELGEMPFDGKRMIFSGFKAIVNEGPGGTAGYADGFVGAVPTASRDAFIDHAAKAAPLFLRAGALRVVECWGDDVTHGKVTDFYRAAAAKDDETIVFSWVEWPDKASRDAGQVKVFAEMDTHMQDNPMPFDGKRMIFGGFEIVNPNN